MDVASLRDKLGTWTIAPWRRMETPVDDERKTLIYSNKPPSVRF
jgi:hypothetical protein